MSTHAPPVPPAQQSDKIWGEHSPPDTTTEVKRDPGAPRPDLNLKEQGDAGNREQNVNAVQHKVQDR